MKSNASSKNLQKSVIVKLLTWAFGILNVQVNSEKTTTENMIDYR